MNMSHKSVPIPDHSSEDDFKSDDGIPDDEYPRPSISNEFTYSKYNTKKIINQFGGKSEDFNPEDYEVDLDEHIDPKITDKTKKIIIPIFLALAAAAVIMTLTGLSVPDFTGEIIGLFIIITLTWVGAVIGMIGTYLWGSVEEAIDFFQKQNEKFKDNVAGLGEIRADLREETEQLFFGVGKLNRTAKNLEEHLKEFDKLRSELKEIVSENEDLGHLMDDLNEQYDNLVSVIANNERAQLLSIFYEISTKDNDEGLSALEYERFLDRLNDSTKEFFEEEGSFEQLAGEDDVMDLREFELVLDNVIKRQEEIFLRAEI